MVWNFLEAFMRMVLNCCFDVIVLHVIWNIKYQHNFLISNDWPDSPFFCSDLAKLGVLCVTFVKGGNCHIFGCNKSVVVIL